MLLNEKLVSVEITLKANLQRFAKFIMGLSAATTFCTIVSVPSMAAPTQASVPFVPSVQSPVLKESVVKTRRAKSFHESKTARAQRLRDLPAHQYYILFTSSGQSTIKELGQGKCMLAGAPGTIMTSNGNDLSMISGAAEIDNCGAAPVKVTSTINSTDAVVSVFPGATLYFEQQSDFVRLNVVRGSIELRGEGFAKEFSNEDGDVIVAGGVVSKQLAQAHPQFTYESGATPVHLWSGSACQFGVTDAGIIEFLRGDGCFSCKRHMQINTLAGTVSCDGDGLLAVHTAPQGLCVENTSLLLKAKLESHGHIIPINGLRSVVVQSGAPNDDLVPVDGVKRRNLYAAFDGYITVLKSEFSVLSLLKRYQNIRLAVIKPASPFEKRLVGTCIKDMAIVATLLEVSDDEYVEKPKISGVVKLGAFFNPFYAKTD